MNNLKLHLICATVGCRMYVASKKSKSIRLKVPQESEIFLKAFLGSPEGVLKQSQRRFKEVSKESQKSLKEVPKD